MPQKITVDPSEVEPVGGKITVSPDELDKPGDKPASTWDMFKSSVKLAPSVLKGMASEFGTGAAKGAGHTLETIGNTGIGHMEFDRKTGQRVDDPKARQAATDKKYEATNPLQSVGRGVEQFAEFLIPLPGGKVSATANAPSWIRRLVTAGTQAAVETGLRTYAQTGDTNEALKAAGVGGALGGALGAASGAKIFPGFQNKLAPEAQRGVDALEQRGVPLSAGDKTGSKVLKTLEQKGQYAPGSHGPLTAFDAQRATAGRSALEGLPGELPGRGGQTTEETGKGVESAVRGSIQDLKGKASKAYDKVREELAKTSKQTITATRQSSVLGPDGRPVSTPIISTTEAPVPMAPVRAALKPYYDELTGRLPATVRESSPGYATLRDIVEGKEATVDALKLDRDLSTLKGFLRREGAGLKDKSGRYAAATVTELESGVQKAIGDASPEALAALKEGRAAVRQYYMQDELLSRLLPKDRSPSVIYDRLTSSSGRLLPDLKELNRIAPKEVENVARTYTEGMVNDITADGGLKRIGSAMKKMRDLKPEVKEILFGKEKAGQIEDVLRGLQQIGADTNPSGTAKWVALATALEGTGAALAGIATGHPGPAAGMVLSAVAANRMAKLLTTPNGIALLQSTIKLPEGSPALRRALQALAAESQKP